MKGRSFRVAADIGGTFTDLVFQDAQTGQCSVAKVLSTPDNLALAVIEGLVANLPSESNIDFFIHGTTVGLNAVLTRRGAKAALLTTENYRDVYTIQGNTNIVKVAPDGTISPFASSGLSNPVGMAFDPGGDLFVANLNSREIHRYSPDGTDHLFATPGEPGRTALQFLAIQSTTGAIPEPSSLLLAAIGMGVLGAVGLRSRRRATTLEAREKTREEDTDHRDTCA